MLELTVGVLCTGGLGCGRARDGPVNHVKGNAGFSGTLRVADALCAGFRRPARALALRGSDDAVSCRAGGSRSVGLIDPRAPLRHGAGHRCGRFRSGSKSWPDVFRPTCALAAGAWTLTPRELRTGDNISPVYKVIRDSDRPMILLEFPFGTPRMGSPCRLLRGVSPAATGEWVFGILPRELSTSDSRVQRAGAKTRERPGARSWASGATHVLVHEAALPSTSPEGDQRLVAGVRRA